MTTLTAVSRERHGHRRWQHYRRYEFARGFSLCSLVLAELDELTLSLPFGFIERHDRLVPVAILGRAGGQCLHVGAQGQWVGSYVPAILRGYPFRLIRTEDGRLVLHIDEGSGLVVSAEDEGEPFFEGHEPSQALQEVKTFLENLETSRQQTAEACAQLQELELVQAWPDVDDETLSKVPHSAPMPGLLRIDSTAVAGLDGTALERLNRSGGLQLALYQPLAERHLAVHAVLERAHLQRHEKSAEETTAEDYFETDDNLSFAWED